MNRQGFPSRKPNQLDGVSRGSISHSPIEPRGSRVCLGPSNREVGCPMLRGLGLRLKAPKGRSGTAGTWLVSLVKPTNTEWRLMTSWVIIHLPRPPPLQAVFFRVPFGSVGFVRELYGLRPWRTPAYRIERPIQHEPIEAASVSPRRSDRLRLPRGDPDPPLDTRLRGFGASRLGCLRALNPSNWSLWAGVLDCYWVGSFDFSFLVEIKLGFPN